MTQRPSLISHLESAPGRELYFFALYRVLEAGVLAGLMFSPLSGILGELRSPELGVVVTIGYLLFSVLMMLLSRQRRWLVPLVLVGVSVGSKTGMRIMRMVPATAAP